MATTLPIITACIRCTARWRISKRFCAKRIAAGLRVITELVLNHTSDQHPWFQRARRAPAGSKFRDYYVWNDTPDKYKGTRIIFKDTEISNWTWDAVANAYYWHRFLFASAGFEFRPSRRPRGNVQGPGFLARPGRGRRAAGRRAVSLRARRHQLRKSAGDARVSEKAPRSMWMKNTATACCWPRPTNGRTTRWPILASGKGDECHMAFHFPLMPRLFMSLRMEDRVPIVDILQQTPPIPETAQWALFLRNHDELTLEMVTDEERDYMYRMYAHIAPGAAEPGHPPPPRAAGGQ